MSDEDWEDIDLVVANDDQQHSASAEPLVAAAQSERENRVLLLLQQGEDTSGNNNILNSATYFNNATSAASGGGGGEDEESIRKRVAAVSSAHSLLATIPSRVRSLTFVGAHLHGKSALVRDLVGPRNVLMPAAVYDHHRGLTTATYIQSGIVRGGPSALGNQSSVLLTAVDVPGHSNFAAELPPAILLSDCAALVVDAVEGVTAYTERTLDAVVSESVPLFLVISKIDRILVELRIPPNDAYKKLRHIVDTVNVMLSARSAPLVSPCHGTVVFTSSRFNIALSLPLVAEKYREQFGPKVHSSWLASQLWGQIGFDSSKRKFVPLNKPTSATVAQDSSSSSSNVTKASFVSFVLEPLFKSMISAFKAPSSASSAATQSGGGTTGGAGGEASVTITNIIKQKVETVFGSYSTNLPDCFLIAMKNSVSNSISSSSSSSASSTTSEILREPPYAVSVLENVFGMPSPLSHHYSLRGLTAAEAEETNSLRAGSAYGVISGKIRLEVDPNSNSNNNSGSGGGSKVTRVFAVVKLLSGELAVKQTISLYSAPDAEIQHATPRMILLVLGRNELVPVRNISSGVIALIDFVDPKSSLESSSSTASAPPESIVPLLYSPSLLIPESCQPVSELLPVQRRTDVGHVSFTKVAIEPQNIKELPQLRNVVASLAAEKAGLGFEQDDSGDLVVSAAGEVQLDAALFDIRKHCAIRVTAPFTAFAETIALADDQLGVMRRHAVQDFALSAFASTLGKDTEQALERGIFHDFRKSSSSSSLSPRFFNDKFNTLRSECGWDLIDCDTFVDVVGSSVGGSGSSSAASGGAVPSTCLLFADSRKRNSNNNNNPNNQNQSSGNDNNVFRWAAFGAGSTVRHGPLCGEPVRNVRFTIVDIVTQQQQQQQQQSGSGAGGGLLLANQGAVTSCARNVTTKALLSAAPRLLEPVMEVHVTLPQARIDEVTLMIQKRRGAVLNEQPIPATTWTVLFALLPLADSFGFETSVRVSTEGEAFPMLQFHDWSIVPGDPLDSSLPRSSSPYEAATGVMLARDFVSKTRKRKGMSETVQLI